MVLSIGSYFGYRPKPDAEWQRIIEKLWKVYGIRSSGSKALDKQILHEHELKDAQKEASVQEGKYLTVNRFEQEKIIKKKEEKKADTEVKTDSDEKKGAETLGKQIFLAIQMKQKHDIEENKKKRNNKYQS